MTSPFACLDGRIRVFPGDMLEVLPTLAPDSLDSCVCDPPYHLTSIVQRFGAEGAAAAKAGATGAYARASAGFMGKTWDGGDIAFRPETWAAVWRVLKPGAYIVAFSSSRTFGRMSVAMEEAGFITHPLIGRLFDPSDDLSAFLDSLSENQLAALCRLIELSDPVAGLLAWTFGAGFPKATRLKAEGFDGFRYGAQALKPALEPIYMGQKPFSEATGTANVLKHGTGALNIEACRIPSTGQRPVEIMSWAEEKPLCVSCAELAARKAKHGTPAIRASIATEHADLILSEKEESIPVDIGKRAIGCCGGTREVHTDISSNISASGKMQMEAFPTDLRFTTETKTKATIGSKTCNCCGRTFIADITSASTSRTQNVKPQTQSEPAARGREGELSANKRYATAGSTNFAASPGPRGGSELGRWPANLITDGSDTVVAGFPLSAGQQGDIRGDEPSAPLGGDIYGDGLLRRAAPKRGDAGSAARFFYAAKADADDRIASRHPTVKPLDLIQYLTRLVTPPGGTILDCFAGTGTTGEAAYREGMRAVLIEREADSIADIRRRMALLTAGPAERKRAIARAKKAAADSDGPLFDPAPASPPMAAE